MTWLKLRKIHKAENRNQKIVRKRHFPDVSTAFFAEEWLRQTKRAPRQCSRSKIFILGARSRPRFYRAVYFTSGLTPYVNWVPFRGGRLNALLVDMRFHVTPRCVPANYAARRLGISEVVFLQMEPRLRQNGFPLPDPVTGNYDLVAIEAWLDRRSGLAPHGLRPIDAADGFEQRLAQIG